MRRALVFVLVFAACQGERRPPLVAGEGILVDEAQTVRVDPSRVPLVASCQDGQVVKRSGDGWACAAAEVSDLSARLDRAERRYDAQLDALSARASAMESQLVDIVETRNSARTRLSDLQAAYSRNLANPHAVAAVTCALREDVIAARRADVSAGKLFHAAGSTGEIVAFCPIVATSSVPRWTALEMTYVDPDGTAAGAQVTAELAFVSAAGALTRVVRLDSNSSNEVIEREMTAPIGQALDFAARHYFVEVIIRRTAQTVQPGIWGVRLTGR